jgi:hypothetical protein
LLHPDGAGTLCPPGLLRIIGSIQPDGTPGRSSRTPRFNGMTSSSIGIRTGPRRARRRRTRARPFGGLRSVLARLWPGARTRRRMARSWRRAPGWIRVASAVLAIVALGFLVNAFYQVVRKPTELYFPIDGVLAKAPAATWREYEPLFRRHSTAVVTPELLAALAQIEGSGNPVARTYWRWRLTAEPFDVYRPASSAVGMYQITDAAFEDARRFCIHDHVVVEDGPWYDWRSCWFNALYLRVVPSHAVELTAVLLDRGVTRALARARVANATPAQKQDLAALIHLCGAGAGEAFARRGLRLAPAQRCGDHDAATYLRRVATMKRVFARLAADG